MPFLVEPGVEDRSRNRTPPMLKVAAQIAFTLLLFAGAATGAVAEKRVALVIGNSSYEHAAILRNPTNDAREVSAALTRLGFDVSVASNLGFDAMRQALRDFSNTAHGADVALIFFAGHGIEFSNRNYLVPTDAELKSDTDIQYEAISLDLAMRAVEKAKGLRIVLLDACRNNPFVRSMKMTLGRRSVGRGLSGVEPSVGTLVGYAAKEGTTADDGFGSHSPFTQGLLKYLEEPGLEIQFMFRKVRDYVLSTTNGRQEPFTYGSLPGRRIFLKPPTESTKNEINVEVAYWNSIRESGDEALLKTYLKRFPGGQFSTLATMMIDRIRRQDQAKKQKKSTIPTDEKRANFDPTIRVPLLSGKALVLRIQQELKRLGCDPGEIDGQWGSKSRDALSAFARHGKYQLSSAEPNTAVLEAVIRRRTRVCPLKCGPLFEPRDDKCTLKTCPRGQSLSATGKCVKDKSTTRAISKRLQFYSDVGTYKWNAMVYGELTKPEGQGPFPAVVLLNSCNEPDRKDIAAMREHAKFLSRSGFVTLLLDSFRGRNLSNGAACKDDDVIWRASRFFRGRDAYNAHAYLTQREYVDASNIFLLGGGGTGGAAAFRVAFDDHARDAAFQAIVALYPWCDLYISTNSLKTHLLVISGARNTVTPPKQCTAVKKRGASTSSDYEVLLLRGAYYAFDIRWEKHKWKHHWLGYNARATSQARQAMLEFFKSHRAN